MNTLSRRDAIRHVMLAGAGLATVSDVAVSAARQLGSYRQLVPFTDLPENIAFTRTGTFPLPGRDALGTDLRRVTWTTPINDTFTVAHFNTPTVDAGSWRLKLEGGVGRPMTLTLDELKKGPRVEHTAMLAWTFWSVEIDPLAPGAHTVSSRATDRRGRTQPADLSLEKSNWENNAVWVRKIHV